MKKLAIVTDSTADLPVLVREILDITVVPLKVNFGTESYTEGVDITNREFYEKLEAANVLPTTSQPSPADFIAVYEGLLEQGYDSVISIHLSDKLSGTRQSAVLAGKEMEGKFQNFAVVDSRQVSVGLGLLVEEAAKMAVEGKSFSEVMTVLEAGIERMQLYVLVDTLKYLEKGGRIGKARALVGSLLNIKPILTMEDGGITDKDKVRTRKKGMQTLAGYAKKYQAERGTLRLALCHSLVEEEAEKLAQLLHEEVGQTPAFISDVGAVVGTHIGPGALFLAVY